MGESAVKSSSEELIPLDDAHEILASFGIGPYNKAYQRWRRDDGFRPADLETVLSESACFLGIDWGDDLSNVMELVASQLAAMEIDLTADMDEETPSGVIQIGGCAARIEYVPSSDDDFDDVLQAINRLISDKAHYRKLRTCEGTDGWCYAVLSNAVWAELESGVPTTLNRLFCRVS